jgi:iron complex transport system ATP-binding protein
MIDVNNLTYKIGKRNIVDNVSFSIGKGDFVCFMGANGAGKSTIIKLLCNLLTPSSGSIDITQKNIGDYTRKELAALMAYVPQFSPNDIHFSVEEFVATGRYPHQSAFQGVTDEDEEIVEWAMELTSVRDMRARDISTLSGGEHQRVMIAAALAQDTPILLLDEPTIYLDPKSSMNILELLRQIHAGGTTIAMVTHDINQALMFGTKFIGVKDGKLIFTETNIKNLGLDELFDMQFHRIEVDGRMQILPNIKG